MPNRKFTGKTSRTGVASGPNRTSPERKTVPDKRNPGMRLRREAKVAVFLAGAPKAMRTTPISGIRRRAGSRML
jgi:hypothetical protein